MVMKTTKTMRGGILRRLRHRDDAGVSIVEVAVAAFIIMVIAVGVFQGTVTSIRLAADQRHRVTALSIAAGEIDLVRSMPDPFKVVSRPTPVTKQIDGITYTLSRTASWVTGSGTEISCGGGGGQNLLLRSVHVSVTWNGRLVSTQPVRSDTLLAPNGRINDPDLGTIIIAVTGANGQPIEGVSAQITAVSGGAVTPTTQPTATNSEGCTYALEVEPGKYTVKISRSGYLDEHQVATPVQTIESLAPGGTATLTYVYDHGATYQPKVVTTDGAAVTGTVKFPSANNTVTFIQSGGQADVVAMGTSIPTTTTLFPRDEGYSAIAGTFSAASTDDPPRNGAGAVQFSSDGGCRALDPDQWKANASGPALQPGFKDEATTGPALNVYMGYAEVTPNSGSGTITVTATQQGGGTTAVPGEPGCATAATVAQGGSGTPTTYTFTTVARGSATKLMLPFGTWKLDFTVASKVTVPSNPAGLTGAINPSNASSTAATSVTVIVDPRRVP
jgi:hypothetical protein